MDAERSPWLPVVAYDAFMIACSVIGTLAALLVHEAIGHAAIAWALGARVRGISLSVMGSGVAHYDWATDPGVVRRIIPLAGGIVTTLAAGALALVVAKRAPLPLRLGLLCFGGIAVLESIGYAAYGLYYGWGDPADIAELLGVRYSVLALHESWLWLPFALAIVPASVITLRQYLFLQEQVFPSATRTARFWRTGFTVGVTVFSIVALQQTLGSLTSPVERKDMRAEVIRGRRVSAVVKAVREEMPNASDEELRAAIIPRVTPALAEPVRLPPEMPLVPILLVLVIVTGIATTLVVRPGQTEAGREISPRTAALAMMLASALSIGVVLKHGAFP